MILLYNKQNVNRFVSFLLSVRLFPSLFQAFLKNQYSCLKLFQSKRTISHSKLNYISLPLHRMQLNRTPHSVHKMIFFKKEVLLKGGIL